jgi:hypothetical protein
MIKAYRFLFITVLTGLLLAGCASGPQYNEMAASIPTLTPGQGRIYFFRESSLLGGGAVQPEIMLNGKAVGNSIPGAFFYVDEPAGEYVVSTKTEVEKTVSFVLDAGDTKYIRTHIGFGILIGRITPTVESADSAMPIIEGLKYEVHAVKARDFSESK